MTDRELLELAAKAYWGAEIDDTCSVRWSENDDAIVYMHGDNQDHNGRDVELVWNPLESDHDAFRLAVKLRIDFYIGDDGGIATYAGYFDPAINNRQRFAIEKHGADDFAATRRAIVRAAAEVGKAME